MENQSNLIEYYGIRLSALSEYTERVWNRFNWYLTLELTIFGFYLTQVDKATIPLLTKNGIPFIGITLSILWIILGMEDDFSVRKYSRRTKELEYIIDNLFHAQGFDSIKLEKTSSLGFPDYPQVSATFAPCLCQWNKLN